MEKSSEQRQVLHWSGEKGRRVQAERVCHCATLHESFARIAKMAPFSRVIWIVLDSVGIGALPDAADYDDVGRSTLGHIAESRALRIPTLVNLGLANIEPLAHL